MGDKIITQYDIESYNPAKIRQIYDIEDSEARSQALDAYTENVLQAIIDETILVQGAAEEGVTISESEVDIAVRQIAEKNQMTSDELNEYLTSINMTMESYRNQLKNQILEQRLRSKLLSRKIVITEQDMREYIKSHQEELGVFQKYELRILVTDTKEQMEEAVEYFEDTESFIETVKKYSVHPTKTDGGHVGTLEIKFLPEADREAIEGKEKGEITEIIETDDDKYKIFYIERFLPLTEVSDKVKESASEALKQQLFEKFYEEWKKEQKESTVIQYVR